MSTDESQQPQRRRPPAIVSYSLLAFGGIAVIAPIFLLYRASPNRISFKRLRANAPPPVHVRPTTSNDALKLSDISFSPRRALQAHEEDDVPLVEQSPDPLHALKAFGIATCIVGAAAVTSVLGIRSLFGVETPEQFADVMRHKLAVMAPSLVSKIHRDPLETDFFPIAPLHGTSRTVTVNDPRRKELPEMNSVDWFQGIEDQLEQEAAAEREERLSRRRNNK